MCAPILYYVFVEYLCACVCESMCVCGCVHALKLVYAHTHTHTYVCVCVCVCVLVNAALLYRRSGQKNDPSSDDKGASLQVRSGVCVRVLCDSVCVFRCVREGLV